MNEPAEQLLQAFESHEYLAPDAATVRARAAERAQVYRRRRIATQATGGAILSAGLVAGGVALPHLRGGSPSEVVVQAAAQPAPATSPPATPGATPSPGDKDEVDSWYEAYFAAGYDLSQAEELAELWQIDDLGAVKAEAGRLLLLGQKLPVEPDPGAVVNAKEAAAVNKFFDAGYDIDDAIELADLWNTEDVYQAKAEAGQKLLDGETLPIQP